ncbi:MAG TPA: MYXO-CTERM sorting domain-containing protein [Polyangiaceae bacterium]|nr:MYXO-CTERM sorting domain-containing protein [Polyangiaceae bacterium]
MKPNLLVSFISASVLGVVATMSPTALGAGATGQAVVVDLCPPAAGNTPGRNRCLGKQVVRPTPLATPKGYGATDLRTAYAMPAPGAATPTLGIVVAYHYSGLEADLAAYRTQYGLAACSSASGCLTVAYADNNGQTTTVPPPSPTGEDWDVQEMLSTELAAAMCPECKLLVVEAANEQDDSLYVAVDVAVQLGARSIALSYGSAETSTVTTLETHFNHPGVLIAAPAGDSGYAGLPQYPATSAYTLAVGGTTLTMSAGGRGWTETAWSSTGSGCSAFIAKPAWQNDPSCTKRMTADVAAVADPNTGLAIYDATLGGWTTVGGTTSAAAIVAGAFASLGVAEQGPSFPWAHSGAFFDVTSGSNDSGGCALDPYYCTAQTGYDGPSGWGTPNGTAIAPFGQSDAGAGTGDGGMNAGDAGANEGGARDGGGGADASMAADGSSSGGGSDSGGSGSDAGDAGSPAGASSSSSGCGCSFAHVEPGSAWLAMAAAFGLLLRRRRSDPR